MCKSLLYIQRDLTKILALILYYLRALWKEI